MKIFTKTLAVILAVLLAMGEPFGMHYAFALPQGEAVVSGTAAFDNTQPGTLYITTSDQAIINYNSFNIGVNELVQFFQPGANSVVLNRVTGGDPSSILGTLRANGQVMLINPNGILFGVGSMIDTGSFLASTLDISNADFNAGNYHFALQNGAALASIINQGTIQVQPNGFVTLLAPAVSNEGLIVADQGRVALAAGEAATLDFTGTGLISVAIDQAVSGQVFDVNGQVIADGVKNSGTIQANGGKVLMTAEAVNNVFQNLINQEGVITANSVADEGGIVRLVSNSDGIVRVSGTINTQGNDAGEVGGRVEVLGEKVGLFAGANINASGDAGGGNVVIGGNAVLANAPFAADRVYIAPDAQVRADALASGKGGNVWVWSHLGTQVYGLISVHGISEGGFVETSGGWFDISLAPDISAASGHGGLWLIDPYNITIVAGGGSTNINNAGGFVSIGNNSLLGVDLVLAALADGNVTISTGAAGTQLGDIVLDTTLLYTGETECLLTLTAHHNIILNAEISTNTAALDLAFNVGGSGRIYLASNLTTLGGDITFGGPLLLARNGGITLSTSGGDVIFNGMLDSSNSYTLSSDQANLTDAQGLAAGIPGGYLVTITSAVENSIVMAVAQGNQAWIGASDGTVEGAWRWVGGPETGTLFWNGGAVGGQYSNWAGGEPNDSGGNEDGVIVGWNALGQWNDQSTGTSSYYIIETALPDTALTINAGAGNVSFNGVVGGTRALGALTISSANNVTASGAINAASVTQTAGTGTTTFSGAVTTTNGGSVLISAAGAITVGAAINTSSGTGGNITFNAPTSLTLNANLNTDNGYVLVTGGGDIIIGASLIIDTESGYINLGASNIYSNSAGNLFDLTLDTSTSSGGATGGAITVGLIDDNAGSNKFIRRLTMTADAATDGQINLNNDISTNDGAGVPADISITGNIVLGKDITIDSNGDADDLLSAGIVSLLGTVSSAPGGFNLIIDTRSDTNWGGSVILGVLNNAGGAYVNDLNVMTQSSYSELEDDRYSGNITLQGGVHTTGTQTYNTDGIAPIEGKITIGGNLTADNNNITFTSGHADGLVLNATTAINAGTGAIAFNSTVTGNHDLTLTANALTLTGAVNTGSSNITINRYSNGTIDVGDDNGGDLVITHAMLDLMTTSGIVTIGGNTTTMITVDGVENVTIGTVVLNAMSNEGSVTFSGVESTFNALTVNADDGIAINVKLTTTAGALTLDGDAENAMDLTDHDNIFIGAGLTLTSAGLMTLDATNGGITGSGALTLNSNGGITINNNMMTAGATLLDTDTGNDGTGNLIVAAGATVNTYDNTLGITANDITLTGGLNSGASTVTITTSDGGTIGLGGTAGNMTISGAELQNIYAANLTIGDSTSGNIIVNNITAANSNNISGMLTLNATKDDASVAFSTVGSIFNALTVNADNGITASVDVATDTGALIMNGDADNAVDGNGNDKVTLGGDVDLTAATNLTISATNGGINLSGAGTNVVTTSGGAINLAPVVMANGVTLSLGNGAATPITLSSITGTLGGLVSNLIFNTSGVVTVNGAVGTDIGTLTLTNSGGATFVGTVDVNTLTLTDTTDGATVAFQNDLTVGAGMTVAPNGAYKVSMTGSNNTIAGETTFLNTGGVTLGDDANDVFLFNGGLVSTDSMTTLHGKIRTSGDPMTFDNVELYGTTVLDTTNNGANAPGAAINTQEIQGWGLSSLTINAGTGGAVTIGSLLDGGDLTLINSGSATFGALVAAMITLTNTTGMIEFNGTVTATTLKTANAGYSVSLLGGATITDLVEFLNTGDVTFGDDVGDTTVFNGGVETAGNGTNPVWTYLAGMLQASNEVIMLGIGQLNADTILNSGGGAIQMAYLEGSWCNLTIAAGTGAGTTTVTGLVTDLGDGTGASLTVENGVTGLVWFQDTISAESGIAAGNAGNALRFDGDVTLGDGDTATTIATVRLDGLDWTSMDGISFGATTLSGGAVSLNSNGSAILMTTLTGNQNLTIAAGTDVGTTTVTGSVTNLGTGTGAALTVANGVTGLVRFMGTVGANAGISAANATNIRFDQDVTLSAGNTDSTFLGNVTLDGLTFTSAGNVTFGNAVIDQVTLSGGPVTITTAAADKDQTFTANVDGAQDLTLRAGQGITTLNSTITTTDHDVVVSAQDIIFAGSNAQINAGTADVTLTATGKITGGAATVDIIANDLVMDAAEGIATTANALLTQVNTLDAVNSTSGDIVVSNTGDLDVVGSGVSNVNGNAYITGDGNITLTSAVTTTNAEIMANGSIYDDDDAGALDVDTTGTARLEATMGTIGISSNPIEVRMSGLLSIYAGGVTVDLIAAAIDGTTPDDDVHVLNPLSGFVLFNNRIRGVSHETLTNFYQAVPQNTSLGADNLLGVFVPTDGFNMGGNLFSAPPDLLSGFGYSGAELGSTLGATGLLITPDKMKSWVDVRILGF